MYCIYSLIFQLRIKSYLIMNPQEYSLIAPCGMNCALCMAFLRDINKCQGCRGPDDNKSITKVNCKIKKCEIFKNGDAEFCFECEDFPCDKLEHLDKRYKNKYHMSMITNLKSIKNNGLENFLVDEKEKWTCYGCGGTICVHKGCCYSCGRVYFEINK